MSTAEPVITSSSEGPSSPSAAPEPSQPVEELFASRFVADFSDATSGGNAQDYIPCVCLMNLHCSHSLLTAAAVPEASR